MPVVVQCFHCNAVLELDDGFRGGVCRCGTCGSLLQVPKGEADAPRKGKKVRPAMPPGPASPAQVRPSNGTTTGLSSGAFDPGISSGLARIHKTRPIAMPPAPPRAPGARRPKYPSKNFDRRWWWIFLAIFAMAVLIGSLIWYFIST